MNYNWKWVYIISSVFSCSNDISDSDASENDERSMWSRWQQMKNLKSLIILRYERFWIQWRAWQNKQMTLQWLKSCLYNCWDINARLTIETWVWLNRKEISELMIRWSEKQSNSSQCSLKYQYLTDLLMNVYWISRRVNHL